jgi:3-isopropylmalate/(R)-2-methylmalate dehydratase small subunit
MTITGKVWKYGDNVNTDVIFPGKYTYTLTDPKEISGHALEGLDPSFAPGVKLGDVIVAGRNWGCGSSREQAVTCLKWAAVGAIIATSFVRIFYRNAINNGLPAIVCPELVDSIRTDQRVTIDMAAGEIRCVSRVFTFEPFPPSVQQILIDGGLIPHLRRSLSHRTPKTESL